MKNYVWLPYLMFILFFVLAVFPVLTPRGEYKVLPKVVEQGESIKVTTDYCKTLPLPAKYQIVYEGELIHPAPEIYSSNAEWGCRKSDFQFRVPDDLPEGDYKIRIIINYPPVLRSFEVVTEKFMVVNGKTTKKQLNVIIKALEEWGIVDETQE